MKTQFRFLCLCLAMLCAGAASRAQLTSITVPSTNYPTLKVAIDSLNLYGVGTGGCTVTVTAGNPETAPAGGYRLGSSTLNGTMSSSQPLTINGNGNTLTAFAGTGSADGIFYIQGTDYVTVNGFTLTDPSTNTSSTTRMEWGFVLCKLNASAPYDGCQNDVIKGCTIALNMNQSSGTGVLISHIVAGSASTLSTTGATASDANSYNTITGNTITGASRGVYMSGIPSANAYAKSNIVGGSTAAAGNIMTLGGTSNTVYGVYCAYDSTVSIQNNTISLVPTQSGSAYMIYMGTGKGDLTVTKNALSINCAMSSGSMYCYYNPGSHADVSTNLVSTHDINGNTITGTNSVSTSAYLYMIYEYSAYCLRMKVRNNNMSNITWNYSSTYYPIYGIYTGYNGAPYLNIDSNTIYNLTNTGNTDYLYGIYAYHYNSPYGLFSCQGNVQRKINISNSYLYYGYYVFGSYTTPPTGYTGQVLKFKNNVEDSVDISGYSSPNVYNYVYYGFDSSEISYNTFSNIKLSTSGTTYVTNQLGYGYYAPNLFTSVGNKITNWTGLGAYMYNYLGYYATRTDSNTISNISWTGTSGYVYNYVGFYGTGNVISNNKITNLSSAGVSFYNYLGYYGTNHIVRNNSITNSTLNGSASLYNYIGYYTTGSTLYNNRVDSLSVDNGTLYPWYSYANTAPSTYYNNIISNMRIGSSTTSVLYGYQLYGTSNPTINFYNNFLTNISVPATYATSGSVGIYCNATANYNIYHNTVYINPGVTGGTGYGWTGLAYSSSANLDLRNNIINVNVTPNGGYTTALRRTSGTSGVSPTNFLGTSNGNILYAPNTTSSWLYGEGTSAASMVNTYNLTNDASFNTPCGLWKNFIGSNKGTFTENNLTAGTLPATYLPSGSSYAEKGAVATPLTITTDYAGTTRGTLPDMGALEFSGTVIDAAPPAISYTALPKATYCTTPLCLTATITDQTGVNNTTGSSPRLYYKKSSENNTFGANNSTTNGWKYVEATISGSSYTFCFDYTLLTSSLSVGDSITYFIIAQDNTSSSNTGATIAGFSSCPTSVTLGTSNGGSVNSSPAPNGFKVLATPSFQVNVSPKASCGAGAATVYLTPNTLGAGIQWQSASLTGSFANITGASSPTYSTGTQTTTVRYQAVIKCGTSTLATSNIDTFVIAYPSIISSTGATRCGYGTLTLNATGAAFTTPRWYTASTGGNVVYNGNTFVTPAINTTTTYYVSGVTPNAGTEIATKTPGSVYGAYFYYNHMQFTLRNASTHFYSTTVYPQSTGTLTLVLTNSSGTPVTNPITGSCYYVTTTITQAATGFTNGTTIQLNWFNLPAGTYWLASVNNSVGLNMEYNYPTFAYPYYSPSGNVSIDNGGYNYNTSWTACSSTGSPSQYIYMYGGYYNNVFSAECELPTRTAVTATVTPAPAINVSTNRVPGMCAGDTATLYVTSTNSNYAYSWSPTTNVSPVTGSGSSLTSYATPTVTTTYRVIATDPYTNCANTDTVRLFVNPKPATPSITPLSPIICQKGQVNLQSTAPPGLSQTISLNPSTTLYNNYYYTYPDPIKKYYPYDHQQYLILASELTAQGQTKGLLSCIQYNINGFYSGSVGSIANYTMKMANTTTSSLSSMITSGLSTVFSAASYTPPSSTGWFTINFSTPFSWDGVSNVVIDLTSSNGLGSGCVYYSYNYTNAQVFYNSTSFVSSLYAYGTDCGTLNATPAATSTGYVYGPYINYYRPNMRLCGSVPAPIQWTPVTGLYKNTGLTSAMLTTDTGRSVFASPILTTVYQSYANVQGCLSNFSNPDTVYVNPAPGVIITPSGTPNICQGDSLTLSVPAGPNQIYSWTNASGTVIGSTTSIRVSVAGRYKVYAQNILTGCSDTNSVTLIVNPRPVINVTNVRPLTFCNGDSVLLSASTATGSPAVTTWQWSQNALAISGANSQAYTARTTGLYRAIGTTALGCIDSSSGTNVNVNTTPSTVTASGSTTFCTGLSVTLQAPLAPTGVTYTYQWYNASGAITGQTSSSYTATTSGNYYVTVTNTTTGCTSVSAVTTVTVGTGPSSAIVPAGNIGLCSGSTTTLTTNQSPGLSYQWYRNSVAISAANGGNNSNITINSGGTYSVTVTITGTSCSTSTASPTVVTLNPLPSPTATPSTTSAICQGDSVTITSNTASGLAYQWNLNGAAIAGANGTTYAAKLAGAYTITQTYTATGCSNTSTPPVNVSVNPLPSVSITSTSATTFCQGGTVVLNANPSTGLNYTWYVNGNAITPAATTNSYTATTTGSYTVQVTNPTTGCKNTSNPQTVQVNPKPNVVTTPSGTANACQGGTTTIAVAQAPGLSYRWMDNTGTTVSTTNSLTTGTAGTYRVAVVNTVTGCTDTSATVTVVINPLPTAVASIVGPSTICQRDSTKIKVTTDIGTTYQWYIGNLLITGATDSIHYARGPGPYTAKVTSAVGCSKTSNALSITVNPVPSAYITYNTSLEFCAGSAVVLNANTGSNLTYQWLYSASGGTLTPNGNSGTYNITNTTGTYALKTTNQFGCSTTSDTLNVLVHPLPIPVIVQNGNTLQTTQPYTSYLWYFNNNAVGGAINGSYTFTQNGAFKVRVIDQYGCEGTSEQFFVNNVGIVNTAAGAGIKVYPNPTNGILNIDATMKVRAVLRDVTGKTVIEGTAVKQLNLGDIAAGMYLLYISDMDGHLLKAEKVTKTAN